MYVCDFQSFRGYQSYHVAYEHGNWRRSVLRHWQSTCTSVRSQPVVIIRYRGSWYTTGTMDHFQECRCNHGKINGHTIPCTEHWIGTRGRFDKAGRNSEARILLVAYGPGAFE